MYLKLFLLLLLSCPTLAACASSGAGSSQLPDSRSGLDPRLTALWQERSAETARGDFPIGAGDVLEIAVPDLPELEARTVRVGGDGNIELPLIGVVAVAGHTVQEVTDVLRRRLVASVMYDPSVSVFVREYRSRIVGVIGAVAKPGFHALSSMDDTLLDALTLAGGINDQAAPRVLFLPAPPQPENAKAVVPALSAAASVDDVRQGDPIVIELSSYTTTGNPLHLSLPVRPGDVIFVPERGQVMVKGWVNQPGSHPISPGLTVLGAVSAAGGPRFAAKHDEIQLIRSNREGRKVSASFDLDQLERGEQIDVSVQAGDVIAVPASAPKAILSGFYSFAQGIINIGFGRSF